MSINGNLGFHPIRSCSLRPTSVPTFTPSHSCGSETSRLMVMLKVLDSD